jgi:hypothetical protein
LTTNGSGFAPGEKVHLFWDGASGPLVAEATANDGGAFTVSVPIPAAPAGDHRVVAQGRASGASAEESVEVIPSIAAEPATAAPGDEVEVTLRGFGGDESLDLSWSGDGSSTWGSGQTDAKGSATLTLPVPEDPAGLYDLLGVGGESGATALGAFRLEGEGNTPQATAGEGRMVAPGSFRVTATVLGLIGGTTSSGEIIDAEDRLVALPACTNTSCPWLEPGVPDDLFGTRVECGDHCFVRVTNPETGLCAVAPVLETGPWFTLDDWWNPTDERALNRLPAATSRLAQGYPAAEAARMGWMSATAARRTGSASPTRATSSATGRRWTSPTGPGRTSGSTSPSASPRSRRRCFGSPARTRTRPPASAAARSTSHRRRRPLPRPSRRRRWPMTTGPAATERTEPRSLALRAMPGPMHRRTRPRLRARMNV